MPHCGQPFDAFTSSVLCSRIAATCEFVSVGSVASSIAAAAVTCGAANDVPSPPLEYSFGPQSE